MWQDVHGMEVCFRGNGRTNNMVRRLQSGPREGDHLPQQLLRVANPAFWANGILGLRFTQKKSGMTNSRSTRQKARALVLRPPENNEKDVNGGRHSSKDRNRSRFPHGVLLQWVFIDCNLRMHLIQKLPGFKGNWQLLRSVCSDPLSEGHPLDSDSEFLSWTCSASRIAKTTVYQVVIALGQLIISKLAEYPMNKPATEIAITTLEFGPPPRRCNFPIFQQRPRKRGLSLAENDFAKICTFLSGLKTGRLLQAERSKIMQ